METVLGNTLYQKIFVNVIHNMLSISQKAVQKSTAYTSSNVFSKKNIRTPELIIIHVGTNHLSRDNPEDTAKKICKLLVRIQYQFPDTVIFYSGILPKFGKKIFLRHQLY